MVWQIRTHVADRNIGKLNIVDGARPRSFTFSVVVSALMRRAVSVSEDGAGLADDPADGGA